MSISSGHLDGTAAARAFRVLFELAPVAVCAVRLDGRIFAANPAAGRLMGVPAGELGQSAISDLTHPGDLARTSELFQELAAGREEAQAFGARYVRRDGRVIRAHVNSALVRDATGCPAFVIALVEQLDEGRQLQEQVAAARAAAHDFNNLLAVICGHAELAIARLPAHGEIRADLEQIRIAAEKSISLVRQMLAPRSAINPPTEAIDVNHVILGMRDAATLLVGSGVRAVLELDPMNPRAWADEEGLQRALANMARNAGESMPAGGTLTIRTETDGFVRVAVTDTGTGMTADVRRHLFEPGFTTKEGGHGIGLATVRQFAESHGGWLAIESTPGEGTTVTLWLRLASTSASSE